MCHTCDIIFIHFLIFDAEIQQAPIQSGFNRPARAGYPQPERDYLQLGMKSLPARVGSFPSLDSPLAIRPPQPGLGTKPKLHPSSLRWNSLFLGAGSRGIGGRRSAIQDADDKHNENMTQISTLALIYNRKRRSYRKTTGTPVVPYNIVYPPHVLYRYVEHFVIFVLCLNANAM